MNLDEYAKQGQHFQYVKDEFQKLKEILEKFKSSENLNVKVFLQGSYKNDTNIDKDSDIDIVVLYDFVFESNVKIRTDQNTINSTDLINNSDIYRYDKHFSIANYSYEKYKNEIRNYLINNSKYQIINGNKTIKCRIPNTDFIFDIVCVFSYRFYKNFYNYQTDYVSGNLIRSKEGYRIINFPKQTYNNSVLKNKNLTEGNYKETIRIIKSIMKNEIDKSLWIPSFGLESIIFNVPNQYFLEENRENRIKKVLNYALLLVQNSWQNLLEPNLLLFVKNISKMSKEKVIKLLTLMLSKLMKVDIYQNV